MTDDKTEAEIRRAERARVFQEDPIFRDAWNECDARLMELWRETALNDSEGREHIWRMLRAMAAIKAVMGGYVETGKIAAQRLEDLERERAVHGQ